MSEPAVTLTATRSQSPTAELIGVSKHFTTGTGMSGRGAVVRAVDGVDLTVPAGATLGLVGESGSGKSTVGRLFLRLMEPTAGRVMLEGKDITGASGAELRGLRRRMQLVFQDPGSSFDPRSSIGSSIDEALRVHTELDRVARRERIGALLEETGVLGQAQDRRPWELSGGQLQRAALARALASDPALIVLDEPLSSLDVSTQAQVVNLLSALQAKGRVSYLFISHDVSVVRHVCAQIAVMYLGKVMEWGPATSVAIHPRHPYTQALLSAVPLPDPARQRDRQRIHLQGDIPSPINPPSGCRFRTRCPHAMDICAEVEPAPAPQDDGTTVYCHLYSWPHSSNGQSSETMSLDNDGSELDGKVPRHSGR